MEELLWNTNFHNGKEPIDTACRPIQPPMEDVIKPARKQFSKLGLMFFLGTLLIILVQTIASAVAIKVNAGIANSTSAMLLVTMLPMYAIAMPLMGLLISRIPSQTIAKKKLTFVQWLIAFLICYGGMYASNLIGLFLTQIIAVFKGAPVTNTIAEIAASSNVLVNFFIMVICAPIAEELLFRKLLIERTVKYGEGTAVLFSGLMFALFHGNLNQFVYAFTLGIFFGFIFVKTGNILYTIFLHMLINFLGSISGVLLLNWLGEDFINALSDPSLMTVLRAAASCRHHALCTLWTFRVCACHCRDYLLLRFLEKAAAFPRRGKYSERQTLFHNHFKCGNGNLLYLLDHNDRDTTACLDHERCAFRIVLSTKTGIVHHLPDSCFAFFRDIFCVKRPIAGANTASKSIFQAIP